MRKMRYLTSASTEEEKKSNSQVLIIGGAIIAVLVLGLLLFFNMKDPSPIAGLARQAGLARGHDENATYESTGLPPMGGSHSPVWQNCGIYIDPVEAKHVLHSLEHGAVWITYNPDIDSTEIGRLQDAVRGHSYALLSPFPGQTSPIALTAWGLQLEVSSAKDSRIADFITRYEQGLQAPETGGACSGGTGTPAQ